MRINIIRKSLTAILGLYLLGSSSTCLAQTPPKLLMQDSNCRTCPLTKTEDSNGNLRIYPIPEDLDLVNQSEPITASFNENQSLIAVLSEAVVRVRVGRTCGSGTIVGRDSDGMAIILTNAHVAGSVPGTSVQLERWDRNGLKETGTATVIAGGYGRSTNVDFSLLRAEAKFATSVAPIPLADRLPDRSATAVTFGAPRCEWPSLQVLRWNQIEGPILTWAPEAIGGRSGSGLFELTSDGPRVVGLLTWGGGGEGLGQASPFLLQVMRGQIPTSLQSLPQDVFEVGTFSAQEVSSLFKANSSKDEENQKQNQKVQWEVESDTTIDSNTDSTNQSPTVPPVVIDAITEPENDHRWFGRNRNRESNKGPIRRGLDTLQQILAATALIIISGLGGYWFARLTK